MTDNRDNENRREEAESVEEVLDQLKSLQERHDYVDELFEVPEDGKPIKQWTMADINNLIYGVEKNKDIEEPSEDFNLDKYQQYISPEEAEESRENNEEKVDLSAENDIVWSEPEDWSDESPKDIYVSKDRGDAPEDTEVPTEFEDISSTSDAYEDEDDEIVNTIEDIEKSDDTDYSLGVNIQEVTAKRKKILDETAQSSEDTTFEDISSGTDGETPEDTEAEESAEEFVALNEEEIARTESPQEEYDRKDYLKIKDIFKSSKFLQRRKEKRAKVKESALENVKSTFGNEHLSYIKSQKHNDDFVELDKEQAEQFEAIHEHAEPFDELYDLGESDAVQDTDSASEQEMQEDPQGNVLVIEEEPVHVDDTEAEKAEDDVQEDKAEDEVDDGYFEKAEKLVNGEIEQEDDEPIVIESTEGLSEEYYELLDAPKQDEKTIHFDLPEKEKREEDEFFDDTSDTRQVDLELDRVVDSFSNSRDDAQLTFDGFIDDGQEAEQVPDEEVESDLLFSSQEKKRRFKLTNIPEDYDDLDTSYFSPEKGKYDEEEYMELKDENHPKSLASSFKGAIKPEKHKKLGEYRSANEKPQIIKELSERKKRSLFNLIALCVLELLLGVITAFPIVQQFTRTINAESALLISLSLLALLLAFLVSTSITQSGFRGLMKRKCNADTAVTVALCAAIINSILLFFSLGEVNNTLPIYASAVIFALILNCIGHCIADSRTLRNFEMIASAQKDELYCVEDIDNENDRDNIARILSKRNRNIKYSCKIDFPGRYVYNSFGYDISDKISRRLFPITMVLSVLIALISGLVNKSLIAAFTTLTGALCLSVPVSLLLSMDLPLLLANRKLNKSGASVVGHSAVHDAGKTSAVVVTANDLYDMSKCNFHGMHEYRTVRVDDIVLYAAAMLTKAKGPLSHAFDNVIIGDKADMLPTVERLCYEERLGLSGWIYGQRILVGNRNLLTTHNLEAPPKNAEIKCRHEGKKVLYIAIDNQVAAMLVVSYTPNEEVRTSLQKLVKNGVSIVVTTNDCNVDEESLSLDFNIPREMFKVIGDYDGGLLKNYKDRAKPTASAKLLHNGTPKSFIQCLSSAISLNITSKLMSLIQFAFLLLGLVLIAAFAISGNLITFGAGGILLFQLICTVIAGAVSVIRPKI